MGMGAPAPGGARTSAPGGNGAPAPSGGHAPGSALPRREHARTEHRTLGSADPSHMGRRDWPYVCQILTGPGGSTRPHTGFFALPHATSLTPTPLRYRAPLSPAGCIWARSRRGFKHFHPWRTPRLCRSQEPTQPWSRSFHPGKAAVAARLPLHFHVRNPNGATA